MKRILLAVIALVYFLGNSAPASAERRESVNPPASAFLYYLGGIASMSLLLGIGKDPAVGADVLWRPDLEGYGIGFAGKAFFLRKRYKTTMISGGIGCMAGMTYSDGPVMLIGVGPGLKMGKVRCDAGVGYALAEEGQGWMLYTGLSYVIREK